MNTNKIQRGGARALAKIFTGRLLTVVACAAIVGFSVTLAMGGQQVALGSGLTLSTNNIAANATNTYAIPSDVSGLLTNGIAPGTALGGPNIILDGSKVDDMFIVFGGYFINTNTTTSTLTLNLAGSGDNSSWTNRAQVFQLVCPASYTNYLSGTYLIQNCFPGYEVRTIENTNAVMLISNLTVKAYIKTGI